MAQADVAVAYAAGKHPIGPKGDCGAQQFWEPVWGGLR